MELTPILGVMDIELEKALSQKLHKAYLNVLVGEMIVLISGFHQFIN